MTLSLTADDKIEALVGLVLQAVDQRLTTVREQLVDLSNAVAHRQADLSSQIAECREMITAMASRAGPSGSPESGTITGSNSAGDAAGSMLLQAANLLTERVTFLESRVNQYTNDRVAELRNAFEQMLPVAPPPVARANGGVNSLAPLSRSITQLGSIAATPTRSAPSDRSEPSLDTARTPTAAPAVVVAPAALDAPSPAPAAPAAGTSMPALAEFDIGAFTARFNARLSALVDRAIDS